MRCCPTRRVCIERSALPLTRRCAPTSPRAERGEVRKQSIASWLGCGQNARQAASRKPSEEPMGTSITFKRPDGKDAGGYLANAARGNAPGVVVIQEWWGLSEQIKGLCDGFAVAGFDALAPD